MSWMIGVDEAGYGPNLGPLVVAASAWQVEPDSVELVHRLAAHAGVVHHLADPTQVADVPTQ